MKLPKFLVGLLIGGWGSGNKYALISSARAVSQNVAYEIPMLITTITIVMITGTLNMNEIVAHQAGGFWNWNIFPVGKNFLLALVEKPSVV